MTRPIFILNGPNLNLLGVREPEIYGRTTLADIEAACRQAASARHAEIDFRQSNHEGDLVGWIQEARDAASALVINPAAYGHTSIALHDALKALELPAVEVHLSQPAAREPFRAHSYVSLAVDGTISGFGADSYVLGVNAALDLVEARAHGAPGGQD
jgi:3-dehydroquinate dehydratase-2